MTMAFVIDMKCLTVCHGVNQRVGRNDSCVHVGSSVGNKSKPLPVVPD